MDRIKRLNSDLFDCELWELHDTVLHYPCPPCCVCVMLQLDYFCSCMWAEDEIAAWWEDGRGVAAWNTFVTDRKCSLLSHDTVLTSDHCLFFMFWKEAVTFPGTLDNQKRGLHMMNVLLQLQKQLQYNKQSGYYIPGPEHVCMAG